MAGELRKSENLGARLRFAGICLPYMHFPAKLMAESRFAGICRFAASPFDSPPF